MEALLAIRDEILHKLLPLHRLSQLPHQKLFDLGLILREGRSGDVRVHRNPRLVQLDRGKSLLEVVRSALHERGVKCTADRNLLSFEGALCCGRSRLCQRGRGSWPSGKRRCRWTWQSGSWFGRRGPRRPCRRVRRWRASREGHRSQPPPPWIRLSP